MIQFAHHYKTLLALRIHISISLKQQSAMLKLHLVTTWFFSSLSDINLVTHNKQ